MIWGWYEELSAVFLRRVTSARVGGGLAESPAVCFHRQQAAVPDTKPEKTLAARQDQRAPTSRSSSTCWNWPTTGS